MSFTSAVPNPTFAWTFDGTLTDYVQGISFSGTPVYSTGKSAQGLSVVNTASYDTGTLPAASNIVTNNGLTVCLWSQITAGGGASLQGGNKINIFNLFSSVKNTIGNTNTLVLVLGFFNGWKVSYFYNDPGNGYREYDSTTVAALNTWYHFCVVFGGSSNKTMTFYINGVAQGSPVAYTTDMSGTTAFNSVNIAGATNNTYTVSDSRIYNTALTSTQVQSIYNQQGMPGRGFVNGITPNITQTPVATIYGNQITPADTSTSKPTTSVSGQTTYSNTSSQYTQFGAGLALTPATTGLTISIVLTFNNGVFTTENLFYLGGNGNYQISARLATFDALALQIWDSTSSRFISYNPSFTPIASWSAGVKYYFTFTITPVSSTIVNVSVYVNGALNGSGSGTSTATALNNGTYTIATIGANNNGVYANMTVYDFVVLNTILSDSQISTLYQKQLANSNYQIAPSASLSGTALFSQLSSTATSSAVGAFSLRAVNGTMAKVVQVRNGTTSATQDFYADRLGNLLTAPVVGQSLANWLGGATGYVTTWYDQSGAGNHATQATAANQPVIQRATKGVGYACLFNGTTNSLNLGTYALLNNTPYSVSIAERRNTSNFPMFFFGERPGASGFATNKSLHIGYFTDTSFRYGLWSTVSLDESVAAYAGTSEPVRYHTQTFSTSTYMRSYINASLQVTNTSTTQLQAVDGAYSIGYVNNYYSGEIYELLVFTKSLYDLDTSGGIVTQIYNNQLSAYGT